MRSIAGRKACSPGLFLNINVPAGGFKGVEWTALSLKPRYDSFERRVSPNGRIYFWPVWKQLEDDSKGTDVWAFVRGFISITPMRLDVTVPEFELRSFRSLDLP
jgi:5'-nucleotidase